MSIEWCQIWTLYDILKHVKREQGQPLPPMDYAYRMMIMQMREEEETKNMKKVMPLGEGIPEWLWHVTGRRTWFIDREMADTLLSLRLGTQDITGIYFPYEVLMLCFEQGLEVRGLPLRYTLASRIRSPICLKLLRERLGIDYTNTGADSLMTMLTDAGMDINGRASHDMPWHSCIRFITNRHLTHDVLPEESPDFNPIEYAYTRSVQKIVVSAMLLYAARSETVQPYVLPRSQRYQFGSAEQRQNFSRVCLPFAPKTLRPGETASHETGRHVVPHLRGWVLRVLRDERYRRNADGTFKTVLVPPTAIHAEEYYAERS